jgi:hypothetical protein
MARKRQLDAFVIEKIRFCHVSRKNVIKMAGTLRL